MYSFVAPINMLISHSVMNDIDGQDRLSPDTRGLPGLWLASILHRQMFFFLFWTAWTLERNPGFRGPK
jgi:hypothetical protein